MKTLLKSKFIELNIPSYLDATEVNNILDDANILAQWDNGHNFCVLALWTDSSDPLYSSIYFSRFFEIGGKTVVSHMFLNQT
jgi:hypothetical protein